MTEEPKSEITATANQTMKASDNVSLQDTRKLKKDQFNPVEHKPPRYTIFGQQKQLHAKIGEDPKNVLQHSVRIPEWWSQNGPQAVIKDMISTAPQENRTREKLKEERKTGNIPHPSYDLDGDGIVGARDYFLAKRFDQDHDGRLNTAEKNNALQALVNGYENQFVWNVEETGAHRGHRLLQVRGKFVDAEDYLPISTTYPKHPLEGVQANFMTARELKEKRKQEIIENMKKAKEEWDKANPASVPQQFILSEFLVDNPKHTSKNQIKAERMVQNRTNLGLDVKPSDIKNVNNDPTTNYVENPLVKSKKIKSKLEDLSKFGQNKHVGETERLKAREDCILRVARGTQERMTHKKIVENRKKEMIDYNMKTFGNVAIGIHGKELPKFSQTQNLKEYWKLSNTYRDHPDNNSALLLRQTHKYWAKPDELRITDVQSTPPPEDPFKKTHVPKKVKNDISEKVQGINHFKNEAKDTLNDMVSGPMHSRWTEVVHYFSNRRSAYEEDPNQRQSLLRYEHLPLPSSFSPTGVFHDPLNRIKPRLKPQTSEVKLGKQSARVVRGTKEQYYRPPKENLLLRVTSKKQMAPADVDMRRTMTAGIRTGGFGST